MKTIEIQKDGNIKDNIYVIVNGEKRYMRHQSLKIQVADDKPFEVRVKEFLVGSPKYTFVPKDNMTLQISKNNRISYKITFLSMIVMTLAFIAFVFLIDRRFIPFFSPLCILPTATYHFVRMKKYFIINEINNEIDYEND